MSEKPSDGPLVFVKLGGSLITDKRRTETVRPKTLARLAREISPAAEAMPGRLVLGHGSGSFGHRAAESAGFLRPGGNPRPEAVAAVQDAAARLHRIVARALLEEGVASYSIVPGSAFTVRSGTPELVASDLPERVLDCGLVPVLYGDVVTDSERSAIILSTETIFLALIRHLQKRGRTVDRVLWLGETAGVLDDEGRPIPRLTAAEASTLAREVGPTAGVDVTGGMRLRLTTAAALAELGVVSFVLDGRSPGLLRAHLEADSAGSGTRIGTE